MKLEIIKDQNLSKEYMKIMNLNRKKNFGPKEVKNFKTDYYPGAKFLFIIEDNKIVAFCGLRKVSLNYRNKNYNILGLCNVISVITNKGYGKELMKRMISYLKKQNKTALGFCDNRKANFYKTSGLKVKKDFSMRFALKNPKSKELKFDSPCYGIYINGKDNLVKKMIKDKKKELAFYYLKDVKDPHW